MTYIQNSKPCDDCIFCAALQLEDSPVNLIVKRGELSYVMLNRYPYTSGHLMVIPYIHQPNLACLTAPIRAEMMELTCLATRVLEQVYHPQGFNIGINIGAVAGAGVADHVHQHIVPRWGGDTNFMSSVGETRVLPEALEDTYWKVREAWGHIAG